MTKKLITFSFVVLSSLLVCLSPNPRILFAGTGSNSFLNDPNTSSTESEEHSDESAENDSSEEINEPDEVNDDSEHNDAEGEADRKETSDAEIEESVTDPNSVKQPGAVKLFHDNYGQVLAKYVDEHGDVDYFKLRRKRGELFAATRELDNHPAEFFFLSKEQKKAFWINAHNALTLYLIIDNYPANINKRILSGFIYPVPSIKQIAGGRNKHIFYVSEFEYTLEEIEKEQLIKVFKDIRVPFALTFASKGDPTFSNEVYDPNRLDEQLDDQVRNFVRSDKGVRIDKTNNVVYLSDKFNRYKSDFINSEYGKIKKFRKYKPHHKAVLNFIYKYVETKDSEYLDGQNFEVKFEKYNWWLNEQKPKAH